MITKRVICPLLLIWLALAATQAQANPGLRVFACEPEWAHLVSVLLPEAEVTTASTPWQDPHYVEPKPSLIAAMRRADLAVCTGASLEAGWLPSLLRKASNSRVREGQEGMFYAAEHARPHQPHGQVDRSQGDVHAEGDPHFHLDPDRLPRIMEELAERMAALSEEDADEIRRNHTRWQAQWREQRVGWEEAREKLQGVRVVTQHSSFDYLLRWLEVEQVADLEPKPGLPPSASHLQSVLQELREEPADVILVAQHYSERGGDWLHQRTDIPLVRLPGTVTQMMGEDSLEALISTVIAALHEARRGDDG